MQNRLLPGATIECSFMKKKTLKFKRIIIKMIATAIFNRIRQNL